jgi:hypothetical protein
MFSDIIKVSVIARNKVTMVKINIIASPVSENAMKAVNWNIVRGVRKVK